MTTTFPRSSPSALGIDARGVLAFVRALESTRDVEPHSLMLLRHGQVAAEGWWSPYSAGRVHLVYSLSKSFTAAAVGIAVGEGLIDLDATVLSYFPELDGEITDPRSRRMLVRHILAMASGHTAETLDRVLAIDPRNLVRGFLLLPPDEEPGTVFAYNQPCTYTLGEIVRRVSGTSLLGYLRPRLLDPLGIEQAAWLTAGEGGGELGFSGLHVTTESIAKLGQLYLQDGVWEGRRILPASWVAQATQRQVANPDESNPDWRQGYGFQFWMARHGFRGDGAYGQFCVLLPEFDVVLAMTGQSADMQAVLDAAWAHLLPALSEPGSAAADAELAAALSAPALPLVQGAAPDSAAALDSAATPLRARPDASNALPTLDAVELTRSEAGYSITLVEADSRLVASVGGDRWEVTGALAASGAVDAATGDVLVDVIFVETPHRLHVRIDPGAGTFSARWETEPLHAEVGLAGLRAPAAPPVE